MSVEKGTTFGWDRWVGPTGAIIGMSTFGASAPLKVLQAKFGFTVEHIVATARAQLGLDHDTDAPGRHPRDLRAMTRLPERVRYQLPDRNLGLDLMRVTEAAALAAGRWAGRGDKEGGDGAAVDAMREVIASVAMRGVVVIGEGEKDEAPMLYNGEEVGDGTGPEYDIAVDPVDGTTLLANGMPNAIAVLAAADRGSMYDPSAVFYMEKLVCAGSVAAEVDIDAPVEHNVRAVARALGGEAGRRHGQRARPAPARGADRRRSAPPGHGSSCSPTATWPPPSPRRARAPAPT